MNLPNITLQGGGFVLKDVSIENPDPLLTNSLAPALGASVLLKHTCASLDPLTDNSPYIQELIQLGVATEDDRRAERETRNSCMSISHQIDIQISLRKNTIFILSVTALGVVNIDKSFSISDNRHHAASLLLPGMKQVIKNFLQMSGVVFDMEQNPMMIKFFDPENLKRELKEGDKARDSEQSTLANRNLHRV